MSDLVSRADAIDALNKEYHGMLSDESMKIYQIKNWLSALPSAEAVEVVRCRDCKHTKTDGMEQPAIYCEKWDRWEMPEDFFCAYGCRKGGDAE